MNVVQTVLREHTQEVTRLDRELLEQQSAVLRQAMKVIEELRSNEREIEQRLTKASQDGFDLAVTMHREGLLDG